VIFILGGGFVLFNIKKLLKKICMFGLTTSMAFGFCSPLMNAVAPTSNDPGLYYDFASLGNANTLIPVIGLVTNGTVGQNVSLITQTDGTNYDVSVKLADGTTLTTNADALASGDTPANINITGKGVKLYLRMVTPQLESQYSQNPTYKDVHTNEGPYTWTEVWNENGVVDSADNIQRFRGNAAGSYKFYYYIDAGTSGYEDVGGSTSSSSSTVTPSEP
jgi:hypothetical protein